MGRTRGARCGAAGRGGSVPRRSAGRGPPPLVMCLK